MGHAAAKLINDRLQMNRIKHRQRISGGRARQPGQIQAAPEIPAILNQPQRADQGIEERCEQTQKQLIDVKRAIAMSGQSAQTSQVFPKESATTGNSGQRRPPIPRRHFRNHGQKRHRQNVPQTSRSRKSDSCGVTQPKSRTTVRARPLLELTE